MSTSWGILEKGGDAILLRREDAHVAGYKEPLQEELLLVYSVGDRQGHGIQCSLKLLPSLLQGLAITDVKIFRPDAQLEAAVREGTGIPLH